MSIGTYIALCVFLFWVCPIFRTLLDLSMLWDTMHNAYLACFVSYLSEVLISLLYFAILANRDFNYETHCLPFLSTKNSI